MPNFEPNYELTQLFENDELVRPKNYDKLKGITKKALEALWKYKYREYVLTPSTYSYILKLLTELEDALSAVKFRHIRLENKRLEHVTKSMSYKLYVSMIH